MKGRPVTGPGPERSFVFQDFALMPWATVIRNAAFGLELRGVARSEREAIAEKYIAEVGLKGFERKYPHELSGGMRQRVGLARALAVNADIVMMDEPFSAVDEQTRRQFQEDLLRLVATERKTFLFVTHSIEEAVYVSNRIVLLSRRPSRVSEIIDVNLPRDSDPDGIRRLSCASLTDHAARTTMRHAQYGCHRARADRLRVDPAYRGVVALCGPTYRRAETPACAERGVNAHAGPVGTEMRQRLTARRAH